ncbi:HAD-IA family hydrolase [Planococcus lenghuensis]|uniref:Phosphoglycolate phosphatase n=1 Tax=Planococcus lenghuensis TaxID=2213202 RepID=A0A1Q2L555_9BACL|nr:HAD-IA family hydrolase [Planococcus lenghuensis]AQQ55559.1 phosphoglycolate phosphatase [Planococcus lenghuensis]
MNILWDFDGTLFDTYPAYSRIFSHVLGGRAAEVEIYKKLKVSFSHAIDHYGLSEEQIDEMNRLEEKLQPADIVPFESVEEVLKLANKNVIMTHKDRKGVLAILQYYGWEEYFSDMVTIDDGFPRKPDAASYRYLHEKYGIDLAIGDREIDLIPANELGIRTCIFQGTSKAADYSLASYDKFQNIIDFDLLKKENL